MVARPTTASNRKVSSSTHQAHPPPRTVLLWWHSHRWQLRAAPASLERIVNMNAADGLCAVMLAKGNRSKAVTKSCKENGGFYLGSIGGPAAILAQNCIKKVEVLDYPEDGMEAVWKIEVKDFPAFIVVDNKGNDFFKVPDCPPARPPACLPA
eukprot:SAG11_NODE_892_length_6673_cov_7.963797_3_plen_153_part_00